MKLNQYQTKEGGISQMQIPERASLVGDEPRRRKKPKEKQNNDENEKKDIQGLGGVALFKPSHPEHGS